MQNWYRKIIPIAALILLLALLTSFITDRKPAEPTEPTAQIVVFATQTLYPGATFRLPLDVLPGMVGKAQHGYLRGLRDGSALIYIAPVAASEDRYTVVDGNTGEILAEGVVSMPMATEAELEIVSQAENRIEAIYGTVTLEAELVGAVANVYYSDGDSEVSLRVQLNNEDNGALYFGDLAADGYGELSPEEALAVHTLAVGPLAHAVTRVPLDLGCKARPDLIPDQLYAAILMPWQMLLKYEVAARGAVIHHFFEHSSCSFPGSPLADSDKPSNRSILWDQDHVIPSTYFFFPFDGEGQVESIEP
jgi:hypothetical protein